MLLTPSSLRSSELNDALMWQVWTPDGNTIICLNASQMFCRMLLLPVNRKQWPLIRKRPESTKS